MKLKSDKQILKAYKTALSISEAKGSTPIDFAHQFLRTISEIDPIVEQEETLDHMMDDLTLGSIEESWTLAER